MTFTQILRDETLRTELGSDVVAGMATENVELTTPAASAAVRRCVIERHV